jgi:hypothetical protein
MRRIVFVQTVARASVMDKDIVLSVKERLIGTFESGIIEGMKNDPMLYGHLGEHLTCGFMELVEVFR